MPAKQCADCRLTKSTSDFYASKTHALGVMSFCKNCFNKRCTKRWIQRKIKAIIYKNSQCEDCGLHLQDSHYAVFEFHHRDPTQKDLDWSRLRLTSEVRIRIELDKCALLCANCHRVRHAALPPAVRL